MLWPFQTVISPHEIANIDWGFLWIMRKYPKKLTNGINKLQNIKLGIQNELNLSTKSNRTKTIKLNKLMVFSNIF